MMGFIFLSLLPLDLNLRLPIGKLVIATNENEALVEFTRSGVLQKVK
jgi:hypothetical protein